MYDPKVLIANVRRLLNNENLLPMQPWYRRFNGKIEVNLKKLGYTAEGIVVKLQGRTIKITELPIGSGLMITYLESIKEVLIEVIWQ